MNDLIILPSDTSRYTFTFEDNEYNLSGREMSLLCNMGMSGYLSWDNSMDSVDRKSADAFKRLGLVNIIGSIISLTTKGQAMVKIIYENFKVEL